MEGEYSVLLVRNIAYFLVFPMTYLLNCGLNIVIVRMCDHDTLFDVPSYLQSLPIYFTRTYSVYSFVSKVFWMVLFL